LIETEQKKEECCGGKAVDFEVLQTWDKILTQILKQ
jgi:hypothetical protein